MLPSHVHGKIRPHSTQFWSGFVPVIHFFRTPCNCGGLPTILWWCTDNDNLREASRTANCGIQLCKSKFWALICHQGFFTLVIYISNRWMWSNWRKQISQQILPAQNLKICNKVVNDKFGKMSVFMLNSVSRVLADTEHQAAASFDSFFCSVSKQRLNYVCPCGENCTIRKLW